MLKVFVPLKKYNYTIVASVEPYYDKFRHASLSEEKCFELTDKRLVLSFLSLSFRAGSWENWQACWTYDRNITLAKFKAVPIKSICIHDCSSRGCMIYCLSFWWTIDCFMSISETQVARTIQLYYIWADSVAFQQNFLI